MNMFNYKWHPQPSSLSLATKAAKLAGLEGKIVLDCFCGTGTLLVASVRNGAARAIGSDIEDWSLYLRKELLELLKYRIYADRIVLRWGVDAFDAVKKWDHDILFCDPPSPWEILGGSQISVKRDTGVAPNELRKHWREKFSGKNWIGKEYRTIVNIVRLFRIELVNGRRVIANLFYQNNKSLARVLVPIFALKHLVGNWYEVMLRP